MDKYWSFNISKYAQIIHRIFMISNWLLRREETKIHRRRDELRRMVNELAAIAKQTFLANLFVFLALA